MSYIKHCGRFVDPQNISCAHGQFSSALIKIAKFKVQVHYHFCFELERILFSEFLNLV